MTPEPSDAARRRGLTVACVWVRGPYAGYSPEYVRRLERMARRWIDRPFRFVCLTDRPADVAPLANVEPIEIPTWSKPADGYWAKVQLFNPAIGLFGRVLYLDLDSLIVGSLDPIIDFRADLALIDDPPRADAPTVDRWDRQIVRRFNSSVMPFDAGAHDAIAQVWQAPVAYRLSTDQDWIAELRPGAAAMPAEWFPRFSLCAAARDTTGRWPDGARVVLVKKPKNHEAAARFGWFDQEWG